MATALAESPVLRLHRDDNIAIASAPSVPAPRSTSRGAWADYRRRARGDRAQGGRAAHRPRRGGAQYGQIIGFATADIVPGQWVHTHNVEAGTLSLDYAFASDVPPAPAPIAGRTFMGYRRADGRAARGTTSASSAR